MKMIYFFHKTRRRLGKTLEYPLKKSLWPFLAALAVLSLSCAPQGSRARNVIIYENSLDKEGGEAAKADDIVLENQYLELRFFPETTQFVLTDKTTGTRWRSNPEGRDPLADAVTRYLSSSVFSLEYADVSGIGMTLYSSEQSVSLGAYNYGVSGGVLEVNYTVGNIDRTYVIPPAIPEERMLLLMEKMETGDVSIVKAAYRLYDVNNLRSSDNREELLAKYPDLSRRKIYILRDGTQEFLKAEYEKIFERTGYTYDDYLDDIANYPLASAKEKPAFNITCQYSLEGNALVLKVPFDKIAYRTAFPVVRLSVLPYFGAGGGEDKGYLFVPDGNGALVYFNNERQNQLTYSNYVYGWDEGLIRDAIINDNKAPFPVFGIQKNGEALMCVIEHGSPYASVRADVSGRNSSYNNVYPRFDIVHSALMNISGRSEREVYQYERGLVEGEGITLRYVTCKEDGYVGMAKEYRSWLTGKFPSLGKRQESGVPVAVEILGAVNKTQHRLGIPLDLPLKLTSYKEASKMISELAGFGWKNARIKLNGWFNRSVDHTIPSSIKLIGALGSREDFQSITDSARESGFSVYPEVDFVYMRDKRFLDGFSVYSDVVRYVSHDRIQRYPYSFVWFGERKQWGKMNYIARPEVAMSMIDNFVSESPLYGLENVAFRNISQKLVGDYNEKFHVSREGSMNIRQEKLAGLGRSGTGVMLLGGHAYAAPYADFIVDMALDDQGFGITDVSVPFYSIVLHGLVPYAGKAINLAEDYSKHLLKSIENGAGLYFCFMTEEVAILQETKFRQFYGNEYGKWVRDANALYKQFSRDFGHLYNQAITEHEILSGKVTLTGYEDGTRVIVNAGNFGFDYNGRNVGSNSYIVLKQGE
ncbi:MAG: DUF5696 domain-containing protein [Treponema sp.]|jgi:hypothetical protein|nr:DUF5696 domain-containing protein [Treponema sp.]